MLAAACTTEQEQQRRIGLCNSQHQLHATQQLICVHTYCYHLFVKQADAYEAYANRDFQAAVQYLTDILQADTNNPRWLEMRAQVGTHDASHQACKQQLRAPLTSV
jgi:hypothetical protein